MQLVSRDILFDVMKNKHSVHLSETDKSSSSFQTFCKKANTEYAKAIKQAKAIDDWYNYDKDQMYDDAMELFSDIMLKFMKDNKDSIRFVGQGSSRIVFAMADGTALKLAKSIAGIDQNKQESKICMNPKLKYEIFPDFYGTDTKNWLALNCELCAPANQNDFKELFRCQPSAIVNVIELIINMKLEDFQYSQLVQHYEKLDNSIYAQFAQQLIDNRSQAFDAIRSLISFYRKNGLNELLTGDLEIPDNWGITIRDDQKVLVIIDAGFNEEVFQKHYS